jgi:hypothetical protein
MPGFFPKTIHVALISGLLCLSAGSALAEAVSARMTGAANAFLATLAPAQRQSVLFAYGDEAQRRRWSNLPTPMVPRGGIALKNMNAAQQDAAMALLASALSPAGLHKVQEIMQGDEVVKQQSGGGRAMFGKDLYYISILGTPSATAPWMLQFGGHHLALNITVAGDKGVLTPTLTGAQPGVYTLNGKTVRPLGQENDKAARLLGMLSNEQRRQAVLGYLVADLVLGPGEDGQVIQPEGLKASAMNPDQRALLLDLITEWSGIIAESEASARMAEIKSGLADTYFAWSGPTEVTPGTNITAYYRIQGPNLVIEYAPQRGDPTQHIHTMYRDPTNDYGRKFSAK